MEFKLISDKLNFRYVFSKLPEISAILEEILGLIFPNLDLPPVLFLLKVAEII